MRRHELPFRALEAKDREIAALKAQLAEARAEASELTRRAVVAEARLVKVVEAGNRLAGIQGPRIAATCCSHPTQSEKDGGTLACPCRCHRPRDLWTEADVRAEELR